MIIIDKILISVAIILVVLVAAFGGGYWWYSSSVNLAYYGFSKGVRDKNADEVKKYMDLNKFVDSFGEINTSFGKEFGQEQKDSSKKDIEKAISDGKFVQTTNLADSQWDAFNNKKLVADGSNYKLSLKVGESDDSQDVDFYFTKESSGWKVTKLKFDIAKTISQASSSISSSVSQVKKEEGKIGSELSTSDFKIKITKLEYLPSLETVSEFTKEPISLKPLRDRNTFAKVSFEVTNITKEGISFYNDVSIETKDGKVFRSEYRKNIYYFEKPENAQKDITGSSTINPDETKYGVKIIEVPATDTASNKVLVSRYSSKVEEYELRWAK